VHSKVPSVGVVVVLVVEVTVVEVAVVVVVLVTVVVVDVIEVVVLVTVVVVDEIVVVVDEMVVVVVDEIVVVVEEMVVVVLMAQSLNSPCMRSCRALSSVSITPHPTVDFKKPSIVHSRPSTETAGLAYASKASLMTAAVWMHSSNELAARI